MEKLQLDPEVLTQAAEVSATLEADEAVTLTAGKSLPDQKHFNPFGTKAAYLEVKKCWSKFKHESWEHVLYNLLRGMKPNRGFTLATNKNKVANGALKWTGFMEAAGACRRLRQYLNEPTRKYGDGFTGDQMARKMLENFSILVTPSIAAEVLKNLVD